MNKKLLYVGLIVPLVCAAHEHEETDQEVVSQEPAADTSNAPEVSDDAGDHEVVPTTHEEAESQDDADADLDDDADDLYAPDSDVIESPEYARGNWYEKQQTLKQAHDVYQEVRQKEAAVVQLETAFIAKKNELTNTFEEFSQSLGAARSGIYQRISDELEKIDHDTPSPAVPLTQEDRIHLAEKEELKALLAQLKKDFDTISELYKAAEHAMAVLMQQVTVAHSFEQKAFEAYEKIAQVLSDQVAKQLLAEIVAARETIGGIGEYIKGDFSHYCDEVADNITKSIALVHQQMSTLKERGLDVTRAEPVHQPVPAAPEQPAQQVAVQRSYLALFFSTITGFFAAVTRWVLGFFA